MDLVDLDSDGPWPGDPEDSDVYEPDWTQVHPPQSDDRLTPPDLPSDAPTGLSWTAFDEVERHAGNGFRIPPPDVIDALAWYTPIHYYGNGSAIYIREEAVFKVAGAIVNRLSAALRENQVHILGACRAAMSVLYLHEAFHHKTESMSIRFEIVERRRSYLPYTEDVVIPLLRQQSTDVLEESLACAEMYRRFKDEDLYRRGVTPEVRRATLDMLPEWFESLPPSYDQAGKYLQDNKFDPAARLLMSQVHEGTLEPARDSAQWLLTPHAYRGLFDSKRITHVVVPVGSKPILPWVGHVPALPSVSSKRVIRFLEREGWQVMAKRGKGSHVRLELSGRNPLTIPANRESLSPVVLKSIATTLEVRLSDLKF